MEFLFLNESAVEMTQKDYLDVICEENNIDASATSSFAEAMLEATEDMHECEIQCMQEEFKVFCEEQANGEESFNESSFSDRVNQAEKNAAEGIDKGFDNAEKNAAEGIDKGFDNAEKNAGLDQKKQGFWNKIGTTLKKWWNAVKNFVAKIWNKIVYVYDKIATWVISTFKKVTGKDGKVKAPAELGTAMNAIEARVKGDMDGLKKAQDEFAKVINEVATKSFKAGEDLGGVVQGFVEKFKAVKNKEDLFKFLKDVNTDKELKEKWNAMIDTFNDAANKTVDVEFSVYKKWCDGCVKIMMVSREAARIVKKSAAQCCQRIDVMLGKIEKELGGNGPVVSLFKTAATALKTVSSWICSLMNWMVSKVRKVCYYIIKLSKPGKIADGLKM